MSVRSLSSLDVLYAPTSRIRHTQNMSLADTDQSFFRWHSFLTWLFGCVSPGVIRFSRPGRTNDSNSSKAFM